MAHLSDLAALFILAIPIATVTWTVTHEKIVREWRELCVRRSRQSSSIATRKFFYVFTCEYCFSHWVSLGAVAVTGFGILLPGWQGQAIAWLSLVWIANVYMGAFARLKLEVKQERLDIALKERDRDEAS
jgi:hypothetical protein